MPAASTSSHKQSNMMTIFLVVAILIVGVGIGFLYLTAGNSEQDIRDKASEPVTTDTVPPINTNVIPTASSQVVKKPVSQCPADGALCQWTAAKDASGYRFKITDLSTGQLIKEGVTQETQVTFTSEISHTYQCVVSGVNSCGDGPQGKGEATCTILVTPTLTPSPTLTPTKGPSPTPTLTPTQGPSLTPTKGPSTTPTPTTVLVSNPTTNPTATPTTNLPRAGFLTQSVIIIAIGLVVLSLGFVL